MRQEIKLAKRNNYHITNFTDCHEIVVDDLTLGSQVIVLILVERQNSFNERTICGVLHADLSTTVECVRQFKNKFDALFLSSPNKIFNEWEQNSSFFSNSRNCISVEPPVGWQKSKNLSDDKISQKLYNTIPRSKKEPTGQLQMGKINVKNGVKTSNLAFQKQNSFLKNIERFTKPIFTRSLSTDRMSFRNASLKRRPRNEMFSDNLQRTLHEPETYSLDFKSSLAIEKNCLKADDKNCQRLLGCPTSKEGVARSTSLHRKKTTPNSLHVDVLSSRIRQTSECSAVTDGDSGVASDTNSCSETTTGTVTHIKSSNNSSEVTLTPNDTLNTADTQLGNSTSVDAKTEHENLKLVFFHRDGLIFDCFIDLLKKIPDIEIHHFPVIAGKQTKIIVNKCNIDFEIVRKKPVDQK